VCAKCLHNAIRGVTVESLILDGWRLFTVDASVERRVSILLRIDDDRLARWYEMSDDQRQVYHIYAVGVGNDFRDALSGANQSAMNIDNDWLKGE